jgi:hypothetical protein
MKLSFTDKESFEETVGSLRFNNPPSDPNTLQRMGNILPEDSKRNEDNCSNNLPGDPGKLQRVGSCSVPPRRWVKILNTVIPECCVRFKKNCCFISISHSYDYAYIPMLRYTHANAQSWRAVLPTTSVILKALTWRVPLAVIINDTYVLYNALAGDHHQYAWNP